MMCLLQETFIWIEKFKESDRKGLPIAVREDFFLGHSCCHFVTVTSVGMFHAESEPVTPLARMVVELRLWSPLALPRPYTGSQSIKVSMLD